MLKKGVYTAKCPTCSRSILMHLASDGSISPKECPECQTGFKGIDNGEQRNTFVIVVGTKKSEIVVNQGAEETKKTVEKPFGGQSFTLETSRKSSKNKTSKKSFGW